MRKRLKSIVWLVVIVAVAVGGGTNRAILVESGDGFSASGSGVADWHADAKSNIANAKTWKVSENLFFLFRFKTLVRTTA